MRNIWIICKRELRSYFATPIAYVFMAVFIIANGFATFHIGDFFARGQAELTTFFSAHPWLYAIFLPAIAMRLWSEECRTGTIELLLTLPITPLQAICGKYLAAYVFSIITLSMTLPIWIAVNYLGTPDNSIIMVGYLSSLLMSGSYLAVGACISAISKNQVICFVLTVFCCFALTLLGTVQPLSFLSNLDTVSRGLIELRSIIYFLSLVGLSLFANAVILELKRSD